MQEHERELSMIPDIRKFIPGEHVVLTSYGRTALYLALVTIDIKKKEVIIPAFTCATTLHPAILHAGGIPVFADVSSDSLNMEVKAIEARLSARTRVIISHHYYGNATSNVEEIQNFATAHGVIHVEDCAHSLSAKHQGKAVGQSGHASTFSFSKLLNCPGGGAVSFKSAALHKRAMGLQKVWTNRFHNLITDAQVLRYESELSEDRPGSVRPRQKAPKSRFVLGTLVKKVLCRFRLYPKGVFGTSSTSDMRMFESGLDTRMTRLQRERIARMMGSFELIVKERRRKARMLNEVAAAQFGDFENGIVTNYVIKDSRIEEWSRCLKGLGVRTRRVWPYFQKYWPEQMTESVKAIRDQFLLVDPDSFNEETIKGLRECLAETAVDYGSSGVGFSGDAEWSGKGPKFA